MARSGMLGHRTQNAQRTYSAQNRKACFGPMLAHIAPSNQDLQRAFVLDALRRCVKSECHFAPLAYPCRETARNPGDAPGRTQAYALGVPAVTH